jgi:tetratricopeptide (TPR) repeat protein
LLLLKTTGACWRSLLVTALFALHPLRVESVAWIAERKDLLAGLFFLLTLLAYVRYVRRPGTASYVLVAAAFALGLMAKPMLVTLPFLLVLFDHWPLDRLRATPPGQHAKEKLPLLALSGLSIAVTWIAQQGAMHGSEQWSLGSRLENAVVSYVLYLWKSLWPAALACFYPHPAAHGGLSGLAVLGSVLLLAALSWIAWRTLEGKPWIAVGWCWYLGMLVPAIGIVQVGLQAMADRYTYLPMIGIYLAVVWSLAELARARPALLKPLAVGAVVLLVAFTAVSRRQIGHWRDGKTLFEHALRVTEENFVAHNNLGSELEILGDLEGAASHFEAAIEIQPEVSEANRAKPRRNAARLHNNLGLARAKQGYHDEAIHNFEHAIVSDPGYAEAYNNLGTLLLRQGDPLRAEELFEQALELEPDHLQAHNNLGTIYEGRRDLVNAARHYREALRIEPLFADAHSNLGNVSLFGGNLEAARGHYERALELRPDFAAAHNNLAYVASQLGDAATAVRHYRRAVELSPQFYQAASGLAWILATDPDETLRDGREALARAEQCARLTGERDAGCLEGLAAAHAELGDFETAVYRQEQALSLAPRASRAPLEARLAAYRAGRPWREPASRANP